MRRFTNILFAILLLQVTAAVTLTSCSMFQGKMAPIAEGSDSVVVNAERAQRSTLDIFELVTQWEYQNRAALPAEVSRGVDQIRKEFPPAWKESRRALALYKKGTGPAATDMERATTALLVFQESLLKMRQDANPNDVSRAIGSLSSVIASVNSLFTKAPLPAPPPVVTNSPAPPRLP